MHLILCFKKCMMLVIACLFSMITCHRAMKLGLRRHGAHAGGAAAQ